MWGIPGLPEVMSDKGFGPGRAQRGKLSSPHQPWGTAGTRQALKGDASRTHTLLTTHALVCICILSPGPFTPGSLYLRSWAEILDPSLAACAKDAFWREDRTLKILPPLCLSTSDFPLHSCSLILCITTASPRRRQTLGSKKPLEPCLWGSLNSKMTPHICADRPVPFHGGQCNEERRCIRWVQPLVSTITLR